MAYYISRYGTRIDLSNISESDINLRDISHHLAKICRYGGSLPIWKHYSVAQHSVLLCNYTRKKGYNKEIQRMALMHDATEAYLGDIVTGLKKLLSDYKLLESKLHSIICSKYGVENRTYFNSLVSLLDYHILADEVNALFRKEFHYHFFEQCPDLKPLGVKPRHEWFGLMSYYWAWKFRKECKRLNIQD